MANTVPKESKVVYLQIGQNYEHLANTKQFDVSEWVEAYPDATIYILFRRPGEDVVAPVQTTLEDGILTWTISNWETGIIGVGFAEIRAIDSTTGLVKKSHVIPCSVEASVTDEDTAPDFPSWIDRMITMNEHLESVYADFNQELADGITAIQDEAAEQKADVVAAIQSKGDTVIASIPMSYTDLIEALAGAAYNPNRHYEHDEFVWYDNHLWRRRTDSPSIVGPWNENDWTRAALTAHVTEALWQVESMQREIYNSIAPAWDYYDTTASYAVGDYVINRERLYRCISPVSGGGDFDYSKWEVVTVATELQNYVQSGAIAPAYSASTTYKAGQYVWYSGNVYRCKTDISTAEAWTAAHWQLVKIGDELTNLKSALSREENRLGEYDKGVFVFPVYWERGTINTSTGADQANNYRIRSDRVYYGDYSQIDITIPTGYSGYVFAYDSNDAVVGKQGWNNTSFGIAKTLYTGAVYLRYIIQVKDQSTTVVPMSIVDSIKVWAEPLLKKSKGDAVCYVSTSGSDSSTGTKASPFATVQKGITLGYKNICVLPGDYVQSVSASGINGLHIFADNSDSYTSYTKRKKPTFLNGKTYISFQTDGNGYKYFAPTSVPGSYTAVFISHTQDPIITGDYPSYRASLWANHSNKYDDFRVKPVLTYSELTENNTFYYDGTNVYFHITDTITGVTVSGDTDYVFDFSACDGLEIEGICILYGKATNLRVLNSNSVSVKNCEFGYTMRNNCVTANYSNVIFENCEAFKATIDGFNSHYYGVSVYNNCRGMYNYDDGESSHEYCEAIVSGGEFAYNGKGGHAPVNGCKFKCDGTYTHHNGYGFYMVGNANFELADILISNSVSQNNATYDLQNTVYTTKYWNCKIGTEHVSSGTVTNLTP